MTTLVESESVGTLLREWRKRRRLSQLDLACEVEVSTRHLSFLETGRAMPSREMLLRLAEQLEIPLRERNLLLTAAGYAPIFPQHSLEDRKLENIRKTIEQVLAAHEPYPALAIDRHWNLLAANRAVTPLLAGVEPGLLQPPLNVLRLSLHPQGLAPCIVNLTQWREHLLERLKHQIELTADAYLMDLLKELRNYPLNQSAQANPPPDRDYSEIAIPLQLVIEGQRLAFFSTTTVFGTPVDVTLSELAIETFLPADPATSAALQQFTRKD